MISLNNVLASLWTTSRNQFVLLAIDFGRFMSSEGTDTLILASTSKPGQSVARHSHRIFLFGFSVREGVY